MKRWATVVLVGLLLVAASAPAQANIINDIVNTVGGALGDAWSTVRDTVTGLAQTVECKAVDWATFTMEPCEQAPPSNLCPTTCKDQLNKLPGTCVDKLLADVAGKSNANATARLEQQLTACNITYNLPKNAALGRFSSGAVLVPLVVLIASMALVELLHP